MKNRKKGVSPIVATTGLVGISVALFILIFLWSRGFINEQVTKFGEDIRNKCENVEFEVNFNSANNEIFINNIGNVNIWKIMLVKVSEGKETVNFTYAGGSNRALPAGSSASFIINTENAQEIKIYPVLLGKGEKSNRAYEYPCDNVMPKIISV